MLRALRPHQWVKNVLVFAAPAAAATLLSVPILVSSTLAMVAMCAAASATYLINDIGDRDRDRNHPTKRLRPIASGALRVPTATRMAAVLASSALALGFLLNPVAGLLIAAYLAMTVSYSKFLKHVPYVEIAILALGFVLRVFVGAAATATAVTTPFVLVVAAGSLFLAIGKRYSELVELGPGATLHRPVLRHYRAASLSRALSVSLAVTVCGYALWAGLTGPVRFAIAWLVVSVVPMTAVAVRLRRRVLDGAAGDPTELLLSDRFVHVAGAIAAACVLVGLYA